MESTFGYKFLGNKNSVAFSLAGPSRFSLDDQQTVQTVFPLID